MGGVGPGPSSAQTRPPPPRTGPRRGGWPERTESGPAQGRVRERHRAGPAEHQIQAGAPGQRHLQPRPQGLLHQQQDPQAVGLQAAVRVACAGGSRGCAPRASPRAQPGHPCGHCRLQPPLPFGSLWVSDLHSRVQVESRGSYFLQATGHGGRVGPVCRRKSRGLTLPQPQAAPRMGCWAWRGPHGWGTARGQGLAGTVTLIAAASRPCFLLLSLFALVSEVGIRPQSCWRPLSCLPARPQPL